MSSHRLPRWIASPLMTAQLVGVLMLLRSVAFDRWMTVLVSIGLVVGARAAMRERSWGLLLAFASACWYLGVFLLGMAPLFFVPAALLAALPFLSAWRAFTRFDRGAATVAATLAASAGAFGAFGWKAAFPWIVDAFPALEPTHSVQHGAALVAILAGVVAVGARDRRRAGAGASSFPTNARVAIPARVAASEESFDPLETHEAEEDESSSAPKRRRR